MSAIKNIFSKNQQTTYNPQPSHLLTDPIFTNVAQMNNEFLHHHKPLSWQNSQGLYQTAPLTQPYWQSRGLSQRGPYRQIRLRTHNWGTRSENGWSGFNNHKYLPQNVSSWEPQSFLLSELRAQSSSQRGLSAPFNQDLFWNQWQQQRLSNSQQLWGAQRGFNGLNQGGFNGLNQGGFNGINQRGLNQGGFNGLNQGGFNGLNQGGFNGLNQGLVQTVMRPAIVQETIRTDRVLQVQPILHREVEQNVINHIQKHITEAPAVPLGGVVRMAPIVQETTNTRVIEEIQPVIHREVAIAQVERVEEHLAEHIVAPVQHTNSSVFESVAPINTLNSAPVVAPINTLNSAPINTLNSAPLIGQQNITKVVPTNYAGSPMLLEKQQQASLVQPVSPTYGSAMM